MTTNTSNNKVIRGLTSMMMMMMMMIHLQKKGFWSKNGHFSISFFFLDNIGQENVFYDVLERKNSFLCYKNKKFKQSKN